MKKVLLISQNFYPEIGSHANRIKNIYIELRQKGYAVKVLTTQPSYPNRDVYKDEKYWNEDIPEQDIIRIKTSTRRYTRNMFNRLLLYLEFLLKLIGTIFNLKREYDYLFVSSPPIFVGFAGVFAKWRLKVPFILDVRDLWPESLLGVGVFTNTFILRVAYYLEKKLYQSADKIVVNSEGFNSYIVQTGIDSRKISFLPNSLTEEELSLDPVEHAPNDQKTIIYTGNVGLAQDILPLVELAEKFKDNKTIHFKIIGYGIKRSETKILIKEMNLTNIELLEVKTRKETLLEVSKADIAYVGLIDRKVFQTVLPGKIIDYMCMKKPIVGSVEGYSKEIIQNAKCGFVANQQIDELMNSIQLLIDKPELRQELGHNGYLYAKKHLRWKTNIQTLLDILK